MKKILFLISIIIFTLSCSNDDNYNDHHGDKAVIVPQGTTVKMMTYNIYGARATNPSNAADLDALAEVIKRQNPDFVAIQEVDVFTNRTGKDVHQARDLAAKLGPEWQWHFSKAIDRDGGEYGDAMLSKHPILEKQSFRLPCSASLPGEDRSLCMIKVNIEGKDLYIASTHLDHLSSDTNRKLQAEEIRTIVGNIDGDIIMAGDFNAVPSSAVMDIVSTYMTFGVRSGGDYTFPSDNPTRTIDYIMYTPIESFAIHSYQVVSRQDQTVNGVDASDHRPVLATIRVKTE